MVKKYILNNGHSRYVSGAVSNNLSENVVAEKITREVHRILQTEYNGKGYLIDDNTSRTQNDNINYIVKKAKEYKDASIFCSIHLNSFTKTSTGTEVLYYDNVVLASKMSKAVASALQLKNRGAKERKDLGVLRLTPQSAILIECFFITNPNDIVKYMKNFNAMCQTIAEVLAEELNYKKVCNKTYTVKSGDSMWKIAKEHNITLNKLKKLNPQIKNYDIIKVGQKINIK